MSSKREEKKNGAMEERKKKTLLTETEKFTFFEAFIRCFCAPVMICCTYTRPDKLLCLSYWIKEKDIKLNSSAMSVMSLSSVLKKKQIFQQKKLNSKFN